jgi:hypothetical protein
MFNVHTPIPIFSDPNPDPTFLLVSVPDPDVCRCVRLLIYLEIYSNIIFKGECLFFDKKEFIFINRAFC